MPSTFILTLSCPDQPGLIFAVTRWVAESGGNILDSQQFTDTSDGEFFLRIHFDFADAREAETLSSQFVDVASAHDMSYRLVPAERPMRTLVMVSKEGHCLNDLLYRQSSGSLHVDIPAIVSNHRDLEKLAAAYDVPFIHLPVTADTKGEVETKLLSLVDELDVDLVVLARYMQILSDDLCRSLQGRAINIHHSFLPSFKGARPYHQAHARGVKLIGATAHYVTAELDEGPIIDQGVLRVDHRMTSADLARVGRDVEAQTLSRAVQLHAESRVLMNGPRTVVFD